MVDPARVEPSRLFDYFAAVFAVSWVVRVPRLILVFVGWRWRQGFIITPAVIPVLGGQILAYREVLLNLLSADTP